MILSPAVLFGSKWLRTLPSMDISDYKPPGNRWVSQSSQCQVVLCMFPYRLFGNPSTIRSVNTPVNRRWTLWTTARTPSGLLWFCLGERRLGSGEENLWWRNWSGYASFKKNLSPMPQGKLRWDCFKGQLFPLIALVGCLHVLLVLSHHAFPGICYEIWFRSLLEIQIMLWVLLSCCLS